ncbi:24936_t:CDS:2, partial [Dentiscutata erythropus]
DLPSNRSNIRHNRENNEKLWLVEDNPIFIDLANINRRIVVWLRDLQEPENYKFHVREIIYNFENLGKGKVITQLCSLWAIEAKSIKLIFMAPMTDITYQELQKLLMKERNILIQQNLRFGTSANPFPNLVTNSYLNKIFSNWYAFSNTPLASTTEQDKTNN